MEDEIEDGEVVDSEEENGKTKVSDDEDVGLNSKASRLYASSLWHSFPVGGGGDGRCDLSCMKTLDSRIMTSRRLPEGLPSSESESDESGSEESDDERPEKRQKQSSSFVSNRNVDNDSCGKTKKTQNKIWNSVCQDQILSNDLAVWSGLDQKMGSDRSVESYNYLRAKEDNRVPTRPEPLRVLGGSEIVAGQEVAARDESVPDICDIETFGTGPQDKKQLRERQRHSDSPDLGGSKVGENERPWLKRTHRGENKGPIHARLGPRGFDETKDRSHIRVTFSDNSSAVIDELIRVLREPQDMKDTFSRVVETVGAEVALKLLYKTEDLEAAGGLMTMDGCRRRTPGGVFLYLVKTDTPRAQQDIIFQSQREESKRQKKLLKAQRKKQVADKRKAMEQALGISNDSKEAGDNGSSQCFPTAVAENGSLLERSSALEKMEEDNYDCLAEEDPSINIELDFA